MIINLTNPNVKLYYFLKKEFLCLIPGPNYILFYATNLEVYSLPERHLPFSKHQITFFYPANLKVYSLPERPGPVVGRSATLPKMSPPGINPGPSGGLSQGRKFLSCSQSQVFSQQVNWLLMAT